MNILDGSRWSMAADQWGFKAGDVLEVKSYQPTNNIYECKVIKSGRMVMLSPFRFTSGELLSVSNPPLPHVGMPVELLLHGTEWTAGEVTKIEDGCISVTCDSVSYLTVLSGWGTYSRPLSTTTPKLCNKCNSPNEFDHPPNYPRNTPVTFRCGTCRAHYGA